MTATDPVSLVNAYEAARARVARRYRRWQADPSPERRERWMASLTARYEARAALLADLAAGRPRVVGRRSYLKTAAGLEVREAEVLAVTP